MSNENEDENDNNDNDKQTNDNNDENIDYKNPNKIQNVNGFKKSQDHKKEKRLELHEYCQQTLGAGNLKEAVRLPKGEDFNEWLAVNCVDFFNEISLLYGCISEYCTEKQCPIMSAGPKYEYLWMDGVKYKKPHKCSAPEYIDLLMTWVEDQINDPQVFPVESGIEFPKDFRNVVKTLLKRLFRVYGHIYHHHINKIIALDCEAHLNSCFKHFIYFVKEFQLVDEKELAPLADTIKFLMNKDAQKGPKYQPKYKY